MKRHSFKYIFYFNVFLIPAIIIIVYVLSACKDEAGKNIPANIITPLVYSDSISGKFCKNAKGAALIDAKSGAVLYEKNASQHLPMASTTKIMTAICVIENSKPTDKICIPKEAVGVEGSSVYLKCGETLTVEELLYGLLLESGNDAAAALAIGVFGSQEACVERMNQKCHDIGLIDTRFENVHGLDSENHYTTAYELALIARYAMKNELFREIVSSVSYTTSGENPRYFSNHNRLLRSFDGAVGIKTGYTSKSGRCLVSAAKFDDEEYIAVTLGDPLDWDDHKAMHLFAKENFDSVEIAGEESFVVFRNFEKYVPSDSVYITVSGKSNFSIDYSISIEGDIGKVNFSSDGKQLGTFYLTRSHKEG